MQELTLKYDEYNLESNLEFENYLLSLNGVENARFNVRNDELYIKYDSNIISMKVIIMEVELFLDVTTLPSLIAFNKHSKSNLMSYEICIENLCCEYCLKINIEDLLLVDGICSARTDFDYYNNLYNVKIFIEYDNSVINLETIKKLEKDFNM